MNKKLRAILVAVGIFGLAFLTSGQAQAAETVLSGDDISFSIIDAPDITFDGVPYSNGRIWYSTNNVLSFGVSGTSVYDDYPEQPSISFNAMDWVVDDGRDYPDEFLTVNTSANTIIIDFSGRRYDDRGDTSVPVTTMRVTITIGAGGVPSYSYVVGGLVWEGGRDACVLHDGSHVNCAPRVLETDLPLAITASDILRLDTAGVTTLKNNVLSCTPGAYTFLNSGATAETAKIQSYVYTLFVNGKAVSTVSTDNFQSVDAGLFPAIAGNLAGTATSTGASWDLKGMSNYSASCQVYAIQSGSSVQSSTSVIYDSVALAAQAEAAAKAQATKDMITNWNSANEALAKKYRDARLAGKG